MEEVARPRVNLRREARIRISPGPPLFLNLVIIQSWTIAFFVSVKYSLRIETPRRYYFDEEFILLVESFSFQDDVGDSKKS